MHKKKFPNHAISKEKWWKEQTSENKRCFHIGTAVSLFFFSPSRQPLVHAVLQVVIDIQRLRRTKSFSQKLPSALSISGTGLLQEEPGSEVLVHHTKCQTCLGDSGEQRGEAGLRPWETFHCSIKKRDGFFLGSRVEKEECWKQGKS